MAQKYTTKQIKDYLKGLAPLRFENMKVGEIDEKNPVDLLKNFFNYNKQLKTLYVGNGQTQCVAGKRRSIGDIFRIVHYYYPKVRLTTVYKTLLAMIASNNALSAICMETGLRVYRGTKDGEKGYFNSQRIDEFTVDFEQFEEAKACKPSQGGWGQNYNDQNIKFVNVK